MTLSRLTRLSLAAVFSFFCSLCVAQTPIVGQSLPQLVIDDKGEILYDAEKDDFSFASWSSATNPGKPHVIQYFGANMGDRKVFEPVTNKIQSSIKPGTVHVSTVLNLDAALWGTSGFVTSEIRKNKKAHMESTMVLDEDGAGVEAWNLGKDGTGLVILDGTGTVQFFSSTSLSPEELEAAMTLLGGGSPSGDSATGDSGSDS